MQYLLDERAIRARQEDIRGPFGVGNGADLHRRSLLPSCSIGLVQLRLQRLLDGILFVLRYGKISVEDTVAAAFLAVWPIDGEPVLDKLKYRTPFIIAAIAWILWQDVEDVVAVTIPVHGI